MAGFIHDKLDIKLLVLYIMDRVAVPIDFNTLTDLSMCDSGVDYFQFAEAAAELLNSGIDEAFSLEMDIPQACESLVLQGDAPLIARAVRNLVGNSIRHNPQGCVVTVGMRWEGSFCRLTVADTGSGFPPPVLERLRRPHEDALPSHGLGLAIVRQVAAAHGGTVYFSNPGTGALAVLTLPVTEPQE